MLEPMSRPLIQPVGPQVQRIAIVVNGTPLELSSDATVERLLADLNLNRRGIAVEINGQIVPAREFALHRLAKGDRVEVVSLAGGG